MAAIAIESQSPGVYPESPNDIEDVVYPCKGCGEVLYTHVRHGIPIADNPFPQILEEGKAFELGGWCPENCAVQLQDELT